MEAVIPTEIGLRSHRTANYNPESNEEAMRVELDLLEERREETQIRAAAYKHRIAQYFNKRVKGRSYKVGDLVLREVTVATRVPGHGKLGANWEGPYKVIRVNRPGTYWLQDMTGKELPHPWNAEHLRRYYQ